MPHAPQLPYRPDIDGLRAVAVWAVLIFHAFPQEFAGGFVGVDIFFVISGYLISRILFTQMEAGSFSFADFYARRIRRIFPALMVVLLTVFGFGWSILAFDEMNELGLHIAAGAGFVSNLLLWSQVGYFDTAAEMKPLLHLWSLGIEEQFYIFWPILLWLALKARVSFLWLIVGVAVASFLLNLGTVYADPSAAFYSPLTRAWELLCGSLLAWLTFRNQGKMPDWAGHLASTAGVVLLALAMALMDKTTVFPGWWAALPVLGAVLLIAAGPKAWANRYLLSNRLAVWFGLISFPLYLWHWPLLSFGQIVDGEQSKLGYRVFALLASVLLAWLTVLLVEKPLRRSSAGNRTKVGALCLCALAIGGTGLWAGQADLRQSHTLEASAVTRKSADHKIGASLNWYRGKEDWLFLGNAYNETVAKMRFATPPEAGRIQGITAQFAKIAEVASAQGIDLALLLGPNKSTIYPEYLPDEAKPSAQRYVDHFLDPLKALPNLTVIDPTEALKAGQNSLLYSRTDTHWNQRGAFLAFSELMKANSLPIPEVTFVEGEKKAGDLVKISKLAEFPLHGGDNWTATWAEPPRLTTVTEENEKRTTFGTPRRVTNSRPLVDEVLWVVGDSFTLALAPYLDSTFREVRYVGHWQDKLASLPEEVAASSQKPDRILIVRVERSF